MANTSANYRIKLAAVLDTKTVNQQINQLNKNNTLKELKIKVTISDASLKKIKELNNLLNKTEALNKYTSGLKNIQETMKSYEKIASKVATASKNMLDTINDIGDATRKTEPKVKSFGDKFADAFKKFSLWSAISGIFYQIINSAKQLVNVVFELDAAFTELQKVTDLTMKDFNKITDQAYKLGIEVGKTTTEAIAAMTEFAKAGYSVEESSDILAKNALMWTNIADGTVSASESANMIISVMKAFNIEAQNTTHIIDALNEVSNNFAVSSGDLSNSLTKSSAVLANAGVTFEEQIGLITSGTEILRNANIVSNGLKTISLRLQGMEEDGEAVDGLSAKLESDFNKLGLSLYDVNGDLKSTYDILHELSVIYPTLTEASKAYYTELIAGKNRAQVAAAILNNFNTAINATETAYNSAGSAARENAKVLDSLNGSLKLLKAEWESLVNSEGFQKLLKGLIDFGTTVLKLIKNIGGLNTVLAILLTNFGVAKLATVIKFVTQLKGLGGVFGTIKTLAIAATQGVNAFSTAMTASAAATAVATAGISLIVAAIGWLITAIGDAINEHNQLIEATLDSMDTNRENLKYLSQNIERYEELANATDKTVEEEIEFRGIEEKLVSILGEKAEVLGHLTAGTDEYTQAVLNLSKAEKNRLLIEAQNAKNAAYEKMRGAVTPWWGTKSIGDKYKVPSDPAATILRQNGMVSRSGDRYVLAGTAASALGYRQGIVSEESHFVTEYHDYLEAYELLNEKIREHISLGEEQQANNILNSKVYENMKTRVEELAGVYEDWKTAEYNLLEITAGGENLLIDTQEEYDGLIDKINKSSKYNKLQKEILTTMFRQAYPQFNGAIDDAKEKEEEISVTTKTTNEILSEQLSDLDKLQGAYSSLTKALSEYEENGSISVETVKSLITNYGDYIDELIDENGNLKLNKEAIEDLVAAKKEDLKITVMQDALNQIDALQDEKEQIDKNTESLKEQNEALKDRFTLLALMPSEDLGTDADAIDKILRNAQAKLDLIDKIGLTSSKNNTSAKKSADPWLDAFNKAYNELKNLKDRDIIDTATYYSELDKLNNKYFKDRVKYEEQFIKYKLELYKGEQEKFKEEVAKFDHQIAMMEYNEVDAEILIAKHKETQQRIHEQAEYYRKLDLEGNKDLIDELEELWWKYEIEIDKIREEEEEKVKERFEEIRDVAIEAIEVEIDELEKALKDKNALLDEEIERYKTENDELEDQAEIQEKLLAIEEARKKLAEAKNNKVRVYREGRGFVYETDFDAVAEAQSELDALLEEWDLFQEKAKIADIIAQLEAEKEANEKRVEKEIEDLNKLKDEWDKSLDLTEEIEEYKDYLKKLGEEENNSFEKRLQAVRDFTKAYRKEMSTLSSSPTNSSSQTAYDNGVRGSGKNSYNVNTDYQKLINEAVAAGAPADHLAYLEQKRNNKIDGEGLDYEKTYNYQYVPGKSTSSSSSSSKKSSGSSSGSSSSSKSSSSSSSSKSSGGSLLSTVTSVIKGVASAIKSATGLATGTDNADGLPHFVGEAGPELYVPPKGSGIIPNPATTNLMAWGEINPMDWVSKFATGDGNTNIDIGNITLPNVKDANSFVEELKNFKGFAIQKQSVRR